MNIIEWEQFGEFIDYIFGKLHRFRIGYVDYIGRNPLSQPYFMFIPWVARQELRISRNGCLRMSRNVYFGNDFYKFLLRICYDFLDIFLSIKASITLTVRFHVTISKHFAVSPCTCLR